MSQQAQQTVFPPNHPVSLSPRPSITVPEVSPECAQRIAKYIIKLAFIFNLTIQRKLTAHCFVWPGPPELAYTPAGLG